MKKILILTTTLVLSLSLVALLAFSSAPRLTYKDSEVRYSGQTKVSDKALLAETKLIDIADRRFESKWRNKDYVGISEEYTEDGVFMKPGVEARVGRAAIAEEFSKSVQGVDRVEFFQDELEFFEGLTSAFQRCHMKGYLDGTEAPIFRGSYTILWKKIDGEWLIHYDIFNADEPDYASTVHYNGAGDVARERLLEEARLIYIADRRFESKWMEKDYVGISEEYTEDGVFMKPGVSPRVGRAAIADEFSRSVKGIDRVEFFQDELEFMPGLRAAFQRCHMNGYVKGTKEPVFKGSYIILWKKVDDEWLIHYDMFNADA